MKLAPDIQRPSASRPRRAPTRRRGVILVLTGFCLVALFAFVALSVDAGRMVLTAPEWKPDGSSTLLRGMWWPDGANVRHLAERSADGGATWTPVWDMLFRPHRQ